MNNAVHIMQIVNWSKYDLQDWLRQFGYWQDSARNHYGSNENPIAIAMHKAQLKIAKKDQEKLIAYYICDEKLEESKRHKMSCQISDDEARAVQKLVLDVINGTESEVLLSWMKVIIERYFNQKSWAELKLHDRTVMDAEYDIRCGLAVLHSRYGFIQFTKGKI